MGTPELEHLVESALHKSILSRKPLPGGEGDLSQSKTSAIALTVYASEGDRDRAIAAGYGVHFGKRFLLASRKTM